MSKTIMESIHTTELFRTENGVICQCDQTESFLLEYHSQILPLKICELIQLKNKVQSIDIVQMLSVDAPDVEVVYLPQSDRFIILTLADILELKSLINGSFAMLELNSLIHKLLVRAL